jgi:hypothetical protein
MLVPIVRTSQYSGNINTMMIDMTEDMIARYVRWSNGEGVIQNLLPELSDNEREFILTGITPEEWEQMFPEDEE